MVRNDKYNFILRPQKEKLKGGVLKGELRCVWRAKKGGRKGNKGGL